MAPSPIPVQPIASPSLSPPNPSPVPTQTSGEGIYGCAALGALWLSAGGSGHLEITMEDIAIAESGGNPRALSPTDDWGLWQIHGAGPAAFDPVTNAHMAVGIEESQGLNAWTTYTSGAYLHSGC